MKRSLVVLTHSELTMLRNCAHKHRLKYELQLDPVGGEERSGPRSVGSLVHLGIAEVYRTVQATQLVGRLPTKYMLSGVAVQAVNEAAAKARAQTSLFVGESADEARAADEADVETAIRCLDLFIEHVALPGAARFDVLGVEVPFRIPLLTPSGKRSGDELEGVMDVVLRDRVLGKVVLGENKTTVSDASTYELMLSTDPQVPLYLFALRAMFGPELVPGIVVLNVVRKAYPSVPKTNLDGTISVAEVDTTRDVYREALDAQGLTDWLVKAKEALLAEQATHEVRAKTRDAVIKAEERWASVRAKQLARLEALPDISRFVQQHVEHVNEHAIATAARDAWNGARLIRAFRRDQLEPWRNGSNCRAFGRLCEYHEACIEGAVGAGEHLVRREHRHGEVAEACAGPLQDLVGMFERFGGRMPTPTHYEGA